MAERQVYIKNRMFTAVSVALKSGAKWLQSQQTLGPYAAEEITKEVRDAESKGLIVVIDEASVPTIEAAEGKKAK